MPVKLSEMFGLLIGGYVAAAVATGASMNPMVSLGLLAGRAWSGGAGISGTATNTFTTILLSLMGTALAVGMYQSCVHPEEFEDDDDDADRPTSDVKPAAVDDV